MKKIVLMLILSSFLLSCNNSKIEEAKESVNEKLIDSLSITKETKTSEIKELNSELDSLKRVRDSLNAISE
jgi:hypothetical protein